MQTTDGLEDLVGLETELDAEPVEQRPEGIRATVTTGTGLAARVQSRTRNSTARSLLHAGSLRWALMVTEILAPPLALRPSHLELTAS